MNSYLVRLTFVNAERERLGIAKNYIVDADRPEASLAIALCMYVDEGNAVPPDSRVLYRVWSPVDNDWVIDDHADELKRIESAVKRTSN